MTNQIFVDPNVDLYAIIDVKHTASAEEIRYAYKRLAIRYHPDRPTGDERRFKALADAYSILGNADHRAYYDRLRDELARYQGKKFSFHPDGDQLAGDQRNLRDIIVNSLRHFQETLNREIPKQALDDFGHACRWVFDVWREIKEEEELGHTSGEVVDFGPFTITREQVEKQDKNFLKGGK